MYGVSVINGDTAMYVEIKNYFETDCDRAANRVSVDNPIVLVLFEQVDADVFFPMDVILAKTVDEALEELDVDSTVEIRDLRAQ